MKLLHLAPAVFITFLLFPSPVFSQWLDEIQTESDWEDWYNEGHYDYNTYQLYRELGEGAAVGDTADFIAATLGNPLSEITQSWPENKSPQSDTTLSRTAWHTQFREGQRILDNGNDGYTLLSSATDDFSVNYKGRNISNSWSTDRRCISISNNNFTINLGNFSPKIGMGLGIGRYDFRPINFSSTTNGGEDFVFPDNSYYNGLESDYRNKIKILYSRKKYNNINKHFVGGAALFTARNVDFGFTATAAKIASPIQSRIMGAGSFFLSDGKLGLKSEIGYAESGIGLCLQLRRAGYDLRLWHYDNSFLNLQSSAPAHPDGMTYGDSSLGLQFRQPQAGESGAFLKRQIGIRQVQLLLSSEIWKRSPIDPVASDNAISARSQLNDYLNIFARYAERFGLSNGRRLVESGINIHRQLNIGILSSLWLEGGGLSKSKSLYHVYCSIPIRWRLLLSGRLRWKSNGDFDYFIEERTMINENVSIKMTYRWNKSFHSQTGPLYLLMESSL